MTTATAPHAQKAHTYRRDTGTYQTKIEGCDRRIRVYHLAMLWWLHDENHLTRQQFRIVLAAHEMHERRKYTSAEKRGRAPHFTTEEVASLLKITSERGKREVRADVKRLQSLGLVTIEPEEIRFALVISQLTLPHGAPEAFQAFFKAFDHPQRKVPFPRRTLRALAAGMTKSETGYVLAALIRSVFWQDKAKRLRVDGRVKLSWISSVFRLGRRSVTKARAQLIKAGWLEPQETSQWEQNLWGVHDVIKVNIDPLAAPKPSTETVDQPVHESVENEDLYAVGEGRSDVVSASPSANSAGESASPYINRTPFSTRKIKNRSLGEPAPGLGSREKKVVSIWNVTAAHLTNTETLILLYEQALMTHRARKGEAGLLEFFAFAHRACQHGNRAGGLFVWLLRERKADYLGEADEADARRRLRELRESSPMSGGWVHLPKLVSDFVRRCVLGASGHRVDPFEVAKGIVGWTREQWETAFEEYQEYQARSQGWTPGRSFVAHRAQK